MAGMIDTSVFKDKTILSLMALAIFAGLMVRIYDSFTTGKSFFSQT
jgi:hypothetical protein